MDGHSSNGAARSDSVQTTTGPNIDSANPPSGQENLLPQDNTRNTYQPDERSFILPSGDMIYVYEKNIRVLLEKPDVPSAKADVSAILEYMGGQQRLKDLIYNSCLTENGKREYIGEKKKQSRQFREKILHSAHIEGLWKIARLNTYDDRTPLSGQWSGKTWQISEGLLETTVNKVKRLLGVQALPGLPLEGTFKMALRPGNEGSAEFGGQHTLVPINPTDIPCHLAFRSGDVEVYIRLASQNVLVGQAGNAKISKILKMVLVKD